MRAGIPGVARTFSDVRCASSKARRLCSVGSMRASCRRPGYGGAVAARIALAVVVLGAAAVGVAYGWRALVVYAFFAAIPAVLVFGAAVGGEWFSGASRGRFDRRR